MSISCFYINHLLFSDYFHRLTFEDCILYKKLPLPNLFWEEELFIIMPSRLSVFLLLDNLIISLGCGAESEDVDEYIDHNGDTDADQG